MKPSRVLLTGGAGYIGSHIAVALVAAGHEPVILDNFSNSHKAVIGRLEQITGRNMPLEVGDVRDTEWLRAALRRHLPAGVIHLAGHKAVGESVAKPLKYYNNNLNGAVSLLEALSAIHQEQGQRPTLIFSSSATVYGDTETLPIAENSRTTYTNPYGHTKLLIEQILACVAAAEPDWRIGVLRYFNPVGAHPSGLIGEDPADVPNNLMPCVAQVAAGRRPHLNVFGKDYPTPDGTGVRDFVHVQDLADGHVAALDALLGGAGNFTVNLGTGQGYSVLDVIRAFEHASGKSIPFRLVGRRPGDVAECYADPSLASRLLGWKAQRGLDQMCADAWRWQSANPSGYR